MTTGDSECEHRALGRPSRLRVDALRIRQGYLGHAELISRLFCVHIQLTLNAVTGNGTLNYLDFTSTASSQSRHRGGGAY